MKQKILTTITTWLALLVFMSLTEPSSLPVTFLIVPFIILFVALMQTWDLLQRLHRRFVVKQTDTQNPRRLAMTVCASLVLLAVLQSLGQLTLRDIVTILAIAVIGYLYAARNYLRPSKR